MITETSAANWPGATEHIPFIFTVKTERVGEKIVPSSCELRFQPSDEHQHAPLVFLLLER